MQQARGFTLIELMITVVIVAILASIAVPMYSQYVQRGKIAEATSGLSELRLRAEKYFADNRSYLKSGDTVVGFSKTIQNARYFDFDCDSPTVTAPTATTFTCKATGRAAGGMTGFAYTINQSNTRGSTFTGLSGWNNSTSCWVTKKGESC
jgi:type IV pilus assembly protein PilE